MDKFLDFQTTNPAVSNTAALQEKIVTVSKIHIRSFQQGKYRITTIEGLDSDLDQIRIAKAMSHALSTSVKCLTKDEVEYIKIQGDHRDAVREWLVVNEVLTEKEAKERIVMHGA